MNKTTLLDSPQTLQDLQDFLFDTMAPCDLAVDWFCERFNVSATDDVIDFVCDAHFGMFADQWDNWHTVGRISSDPVPIMTSVQTNRFTLMRKIEKLMNVAISNNHEYWVKDNTSVETIDGVSYVRLHGNLIAEVDDNGIKLYDGGWQSNTTKSRLNAILTEHGIAGEGVFQKDYQWFIRLYNGTEFFVTEFRSGMRLGALAASDLLVWA